MNILNIMKSQDGYVESNRAISPKLKSKAKQLCWEYNSKIFSTGQNISGLTACSDFPIMNNVQKEVL